MRLFQACSQPPDKVGGFPQILDLFQGLKIGVPSGCLGETSIFVARHAVSIVTRDIYTAIISVRPSAYPSVRCVVIVSSLHGSTIILVLSVSNILATFRRGHSLRRR